MENKTEAAGRLIVNPAFTAKVIDKTLTALLVVSTAALLLGGAALYRTIWPMKPDIVASNGAGDLRLVQRLTEPVIDRLALLDWTRGCALKAYDLDYVHYHEQQQRAQECFTVEAWNGWATAFLKNLKAIKDNQLMSVPVALCPPRLVGEGLFGDRYAWNVQMPLKVVWENTQGVVSDTLMLELRVVRSDNPEHRSSVAFQQFVAKPWGSDTCTAPR